MYQKGDLCRECDHEVYYISGKSLTYHEEEYDPVTVGDRAALLALFWDAAEALGYTDRSPGGRLQLIPQKIEWPKEEP